MVADRDRDAPALPLERRLGERVPTRLRKDIAMSAYYNENDANAAAWLRELIVAPQARAFIESYMESVQ